MDFSKLNIDIPKNAIPNTDFLKVDNITDLIKYLESYHRAQEVATKKRHRVIVFITICSLTLTSLGLLYQNHIHQKTQSDMKEINRQQKAIDIERNKLLKLHLLHLDGLERELAKQNALTPKSEKKKN